MESAQIVARLKTTPSLLALIGLVLLNLAREAYRYPTLSYVDAAGLITLDFGWTSIALANVLNVAGTAVLFLVVWHSQGKTRVFHPALMVTAAVGMTLGYLGKFNVAGTAQDYGFLQVMAECIQFLGMYLLAGWAAELYRREGLFCLALVGMSFVLSGVCQGLVMLLQPGAGIVLCSMASVVSVMVLFVYQAQTSRLVPGAFTRRRQVSAAGAAGGDAPSAKGELREARTGTGTGQARGSSPAASPETRFPEYAFQRGAVWRLLGCFAVYGMVGSYQYANWMSGQTLSSGAVLIQLFGGLGTILAGLLIVLLFVREKNIFDDFFWRTMIVAVLVVALFISTFAKSYPFAAVFTVFNDLSYKLILFFIWLLPLILVHRSNPAASFLLFYLAHQVGAAACLLAGAADAVQFGLILAGLVYLVADVVLSLASGTGHTVITDVALGTEVQPDESEKTQAYKDLLFAIFLQDRFHLTPRESELIPLLEQGMTTKEIAQELVVSFDTAKTHRRNVLQKMQAANTHELQDKLRELREKDFPAFLQEIM